MLEIKITCDTTTQKQHQKTFFEFKKGDNDKMGKKLNIDWEYELDKFKGNVNAQWNFFSSKVKKRVSHKKLYQKKQGSIRFPWIK